VRLGKALTHAAPRSSETVQSNVSADRGSLFFFWPFERGFDPQRRCQPSFWPIGTKRKHAGQERADKADDDDPVPFFYSAARVTTG
jgi:hypothetical protein